MKLRLNKNRLIKSTIVTLLIFIAASAICLAYICYYGTFDGKSFSECLFYAALAFIMLGFVWSIGVTTNSNDYSYRFGQFMVSQKITSDEAYDKTLTKISIKEAFVVFAVGLLLLLFSVLVKTLF